MEMKCEHQQIECILFRNIFNLNARRSACTHIQMCICCNKKSSKIYGNIPIKSLLKPMFSLLKTACSSDNYGECPIRVPLFTLNYGTTFFFRATEIKTKSF